MNDNLCRHVCELEKLSLPPGSSSLHLWDGLIMYFGHWITPLTSHIRGHLLQLILRHMVDHIERGGIEEQENYNPLLPKLDYT